MKLNLQSIKNLVEYNMRYFRVRGYEPYMPDNDPLNFNKLLPPELDYPAGQNTTEPLLNSWRTRKTLALNTVAAAGITLWKPTKKYSLDDKVYIGNLNFISIADDNKGNIPLIAPAFWIPYVVPPTDAAELVNVNLIGDNNTNMRDMIAQCIYDILTDTVASDDPTKTTISGDKIILDDGTEFPPGAPLPPLLAPLFPTPPQEFHFGGGDKTTPSNGNILFENDVGKYVKLKVGNSTAMVSATEVIMGQLLQYFKVSSLGIQFSNDGGVTWKSVMNSVAPWDASTSYALDNVVSYGGLIYICKVPLSVGNPPPPSSPSNWEIHSIYMMGYIGDGNVANDAAINVTKIGNGTVDNTEFDYLNGVTSPIQDQLDLKAFDSAVVHNTGNETVNGIKTFTSFPITPSTAPSSNFQTANKKYVDDSIERNTASNVGIGLGIFKQKTGVDLEFKTLSAGANITLVSTPSEIIISSTASGGSGEVNTASNVGGVGEGIFKQKNGVDLEFKKLIAGTNVTLVSSANGITINSSSVAIGEVNTASNIGTGIGIYKQKTGVDLELKTLKAGSNITITSDGDSITINSSGGGSGEINTASNIAGVGEGFFKQKNGVDLEFKKLIAGTNLSLTPTANAITINTTAEINTASNLGTGASVFKQKVGVNLEMRKLKAGSNVSIIEGTNEITISATGIGGSSYSYMPGGWA
jgi:hypothetical protein